MAAVPTSVFPTYIAEGRFTIDDATHQNSSPYILTILCLGTSFPDIRNKTDLISIFGSHFHTESSSQTWHIWY